MQQNVKDQVPYTTQIIEPVYDVANSRIEFRLQPNTCYFADARLLDVGLFSAGGATVSNGILGSESPIRSISLMDGGTTLDAINNFSQWRAVQQLMTDNDRAIAVGRYTTYNKLGYIVSGELDMTEAQFGQGQNVVVAQDQGNVVATTAAATKKAWISLKSIFPFLANSAVLPTTLFQQLKVVVEYYSSAALANFIANKATDAVTTRGLFVIDELNDGPIKMSAIKTYQGIRWRGVVQDSWVLNAVASGTQSVTQKLRGFDGMVVDDMVIKLTQPAVPDNGGGANKVFGNVGSLSVPNALMQLRVNGQNKLPRAGVQGKMRSLALLTDSIGAIDTMPFQVFMRPKFGPNAHSATIQETYGQVSMFGIDVKDYVEDLQLTIGRDFKTNNAETNAELVINVFGRVKKMLVVEGGSYRVMNDMAI